MVMVRVIVMNILGPTKFWFNRLNTDQALPVLIFPHYYAKVKLRMVQIWYYNSSNSNSNIQ